MVAIIFALGVGAGAVGAVIGGALGMSFVSFNFQFNRLSKLPGTAKYWLTTLCPNFMIAQASI